MGDSMKNTTITTTIPMDVYEEVKKEHWRWNELIFMGIQAKRSFPNVLDRQNSAESDIARLSEKVQKLARDKFELMERLEKLEGDKH